MKLALYTTPNFDEGGEDRTMRLLPLREEDLDDFMSTRL